MLKRCILSKLVEIDHVVLKKTSFKGHNWFVHFLLFSVLVSELSCLECFVVRRSCCRRSRQCCRRQLFTFSSSSSKPRGQFQLNLAQDILRQREFKFTQTECHIPFPEEMVEKYSSKNRWWLKNILKEHSIKHATSTKHLDNGIIGVLRLFKWRASLFSRGDDYEIAIIHWRNFQIIFSRTAGPISTKLGTRHSWMKGIQVFSNEKPFNSVNNGFFFS